MNTRHSFHPLARLLHWTMAVLILIMLFVGVGMISTVSTKHPWLLALHRPLGITILALAIIRLGVRLRFRPPPLPADMPAFMQFLARASHWVLYALMLTMPLIGWAMLSAGNYPVKMWGGVHLPHIVPYSGVMYAWLRQAHGLLAYVFFLAVLGHMGAALYHGLIRRDDVLPSMTIGSRLDEVVTAPAAQTSGAADVKPRPLSPESPRQEG